MIFAVFGSSYQDSRRDELEMLFDALAAHPSTEAMLFDAGFLSYLTSIGVRMPQCVSELDRDGLDRTDMAICLGGDGTFLHTAQRIAPRQTPVLGINTGHLGYLAAASLTDPSAIVEAIYAKRYKIETRSMLRACQAHACATTSVSALNEIAVLKRDSASMVTVEASVNGQHLATYRADGLIVSTPTGSTGYNLSAGGPIVAPETGVWVISPICAHTLTMRPLVVPDTAVVTLRVASRTGSFLLSYDGTSLELPEDRELTIDKAPYSTRIVMGHNHNFIDTLREKLLWGAEER